MLGFAQAGALGDNVSQRLIEQVAEHITVPVISNILP